MSGILDEVLRVTMFRAMNVKGMWIVFQKWPLTPLMWPDMYGAPAESPSMSGCLTVIMVIYPI